MPRARAAGDGVAHLLVLFLVLVAAIIAVAIASRFPVVPQRCLPDAQPIDRHDPAARPDALFTDLAARLSGPLVRHRSYDFRTVDPRRVAEGVAP